MRTATPILIVFSLLLAACGGTATQAPAAPAATQPMPVPTEMVAPTAIPASSTVPPTDALASTQAPSPVIASGDAVVYKIVSGESTLQYEVGETFINDNNRFNLAKGVTPQVSGEITIDPSSPQNSQIGTITADVSQFKSDNNRRDSFIRTHFLESSKYPTVTFETTKIEGLPQTYTDGQEISLKISGNLTIRDVTKPVVFDTTLKLDGGTLSGQAVTSIKMSDFKFGPIELFGMLKTEDVAKVTLDLVARPG
jgi:polyisoprenoid-binding protein YceI